MTTSITGVVYKLRCQQPRGLGINPLPPSNCSAGQKELHFFWREHQCLLRTPELISLRHPTGHAHVHPSTSVP